MVPVTGTMYLQKYALSKMIAVTNNYPFGLGKGGGGKGGLGKLLITSLGDGGLGKCFSTSLGDGGGGGGGGGGGTSITDSVSAGLLSVAFVSFFTFTSPSLLLQDAVAMIAARATRPITFFIN